MKQYVANVQRVMARRRRIKLAREAASWLLRGNEVFETSDSRYVQAFTSLSPDDCEVALKHLARRTRRRMSSEPGFTYLVSATLVDKAIRIEAKKLTLRDMRAVMHEGLPPSD